jgi:hypothetical protein
MKTLAAKVVKAGQVLSKHADKHAKQFDASTNRVKTGSAAVRNAFKNRGTMIRGDADEANALVYSAVEELMGVEIMNDFLYGENPPPASDAGAPPPNAGYGAGDAPVAEEMGPDPLAALDMGDGGMPTLDTLPPPDFTPGPPAATDQTIYTQLPEGAIVFDGSKPLKSRCIGSFNNVMKNGEGFEWQGDAGSGHWNARFGSWAGVVSDWGRDGALREETPGSVAGLTWARANGVSNPKDVKDSKIVNGISNAAGWGPLVGNPDDPDFKNMRYCSGTDQFFWFYDQAPQWAKDPSLQLALTQAITDWRAAKTAAAADAAATAMQDQLDADTAAATAKQQAAEDAATQRQIDTEAKLSEHDAALQARADETAAKQQELADASEQRRADAQMDADIKAQQAQAEIDRAQQAQEYEQGESAYRAATASQDDGSGRGDGGYADQGEVEQMMDTEDQMVADVQQSPPDTGEFNLEEEYVMGSERMRTHTVAGKTEV